MTLAQTPALIQKDSHGVPWQVLTVKSTKCSHALQSQGHPWAEITKLITQCNFIWWVLLPFAPKYLGQYCDFTQLKDLSGILVRPGFIWWIWKHFNPWLQHTPCVPCLHLRHNKKCSFHSSDLSAFQRKFWYFSFPTPRGIWPTEQ